MVSSPNSIGYSPAWGLMAASKQGKDIMCPTYCAGLSLPAIWHHTDSGTPIILNLYETNQRVQSIAYKRS